MKKVGWHRVNLVRRTHMHTTNIKDLNARAANNFLVLMIAVYNPNSMLAKY